MSATPLRVEKVIKFSEISEFPNFSRPRKESIPQGLKSLFLTVAERPKAGSLGLPRSYWRLRVDVPVLHAKRLLLRPVCLGDAVQVQRLFPQWEVVKYLAVVVPWPFPEDGVETYYRERSLPAVERGEEWHWTIRLKEEPERIIGAISLHLNREIHRGFWIAPEWRRRGLMTEAVTEVTRFWFEDLRQPVLRVKKASENAGSRAISVREGMRRVAVTEDEYVCGRLPTEIWEIDVESWRGRTRSN